MVSRLLKRSVSLPPNNLNGTSMNPTLQDGDYLLVSKQAYTFENPERGEIIIFPVGEDNKLYIKRVIGLPGDKIEIKGKGASKEDATVDFIISKTRPHL